MGKRRSKVHAFFNFSKDRNKSTCSICKYEVKGNHATNLTRHIATCHPNEALQLDNNDASSSSSSRSQVAPKRKRKEKPTFQAVMDRCVRLVTVHGRPFSMIDDEAFQDIIKMLDIEDGSDERVINSHNVKKHVFDEADRVRKRISEDAKNKMVCLKLDSATCCDRSFLGVNMQYIEDGEIVLRTLATQEMVSRQTAENLKQTLSQILNLYSIDTNQIYAITTDNGSNFKKMSRLMQECSPVDSDSDCEEEIPWYSSDSFDGTQPEINIELDDYEDESQENIMTLCPTRPQTVKKITSVMCAAHTLQLAVRDTCREIETADCIDQAREVVRKMRTPLIKQTLKASNHRKPILDCTTRWNSTLEMLKRLIELKEFCKAMPMLNVLSEDKWSAIQEIVQSLEPARKATVLLQNAQLAFSDFYIIWTNCYLESVELSTRLSLKLAEHMKTREIKLMDHGAFCAALYLDPRLNITLGNVHKQVALAHLCSTWGRLCRISSTENSSDLPHESVNDTLTAVGLPSNTQPIERMLAECERTRIRNRRSNLASGVITSLIIDFSDYPRLQSNENVLKFWQTQKNTLPQLQTLASVVLAVPSTQVSVERLFSSLKFILNPHRYNLTEDTVQNILIIRNNPNIFK